MSAADERTVAEIELFTISEVRRRTQNGFVTARVHAQVEARRRKPRAKGNRIAKLSLADACDRMMLRVWDNHPELQVLQRVAGGRFHRNRW